MGASILPFNSNLPPESEFVVADCCFAYDYFWANSTNISSIKEEDRNRIYEVKKASESLAKNKNLILIPPVLREELIGIAEYDILGKENAHTKQQMMNDPTLILKATQRAKTIENILRQNPLFLFDDDPIEYDIQAIAKIQVTENLKYKDARYIYYAREKYEVNNIITVDKDFTRVKDKNFTIYIDKKGYEFYSRNSSFTNNLSEAFKKARINLTYNK